VEGNSHMSNKILFLVVAFFLAFSSQSFAQTNLLANPNFESGAANWTFGPGSAPTSNPAKVIEGTTSACTQILVFPNQDFFSSTEQNVTITNPTQNRYWFRLDVRPQFSNESKGVRVGLLIIGRNSSNGETFRQQREIGATLPVVTMDVDNVQFPASTVRAEFKAFAYATQAASQTYQGQEFCFDRALATTTALTPLPKFTSVINGDFEFNTILWNEEGNPATMFNVPFTGNWAILQELVPFTGNQDSFNRIYQDVYCNANGSPCSPGQRMSAGAGVYSYFDRDKVMDAGLMMQFIDANGQIIRDSFNNPITITDFFNGINQGWYRFTFVSTDTLNPPGMPAGAVAARIGAYQFAPKTTVQAATLKLSAVDLVLTGNYPRSLIFPILNSPSGENWDFENSLNRWARCCQPIGLDQLVKHNGNQSALMEVTSLPAVDFFSEGAQRVVAVPGRTAILNGWINTQAFTTTSFTTATIGIAAFDANGNQLSAQTQALQGQNPWTQRTVNLPVPANATELKVFFSMFGSIAGGLQVGEKARFDDFTFIQQ